MLLDDKQNKEFKMNSVLVARIGYYLCKYLALELGQKYGLHKDRDALLEMSQECLATPRIKPNFKLINGGKDEKPGV